MLNNKAKSGQRLGLNLCPKFRPILDETDDALLLLKSKFIGKGSFSIEDFADDFGISGFSVRKMFDGDRNLRFDVGFAAICYVARKNLIAAKSLLNSLFEIANLPFEVQLKHAPRARKCMDTIEGQLLDLFGEGK
jgi:hypothetical protein